MTDQKKKILKISLGVIALALVLTLVAFIKVKPTEIAYTPYNETYNAYCMYYVDENGITIDTQPDKELLMEKKKALFTKKCNTQNLMIRLPLLMLFDLRKTIGNPGTEEQGGIMLEFKLFGFAKRFNLDPLQNLSYFPELNEEIFKKIKLIDEEMATAEDNGQPMIQIGS